jgi:hypothetical protein
MNVDVRIERLVLEGIEVPYHQRTLLQTAVEAELARLITVGGTVIMRSSSGLNLARLGKPW